MPQRTPLVPSFPSLSRSEPARRTAPIAPASVAAILLSCAIAGAQPSGDIPRGSVVGKVVATAEPDQSYAVYLPSNYDAGRRWPVLYGFDPLARGHAAVECFRDAAEKHGFILAASNNSRNGPVEPSLRAGLAMMNDAERRFSVDPGRRYATGFSGGARIACTVAKGMKGGIAGVIGCGAGFLPGADPEGGAPFAFCGTVGNEDYNWIEMNALDRSLAALGMPHRLLRFDGGHAWPPGEVALLAIEWLELQAMRSGRRPRDPELIAGSLERELSRARAEEAGGALRDAWSTYAVAAATFEGLADTGALEARAAALAARKEVRDPRKRERREEESERWQMKQTEAFVHGLSDPDQLFASASALRGVVRALRKDERDARTPSKRRLARRLLEHVNITAYYAAQPLIDAGRHSAALACLETQAEVRPESASIRYRIATVHARAGDRAKALQALQAAAAKGLSDVARVEREAAFDPLRDDARFRQLLDQIRKNPPSPAPPR